MEEQRFLDVHGLSEYIHLSKSMVYKMVSNKTIPYIKIGTRTIFDRGQIDQWILNGCRKVEDIPELSKF